MPGMAEIEWRRLRFSLAAFTAAALAGAVAAGTAWWLEHRIVEGMEAAETRLAEARERYSVLAGERAKWRRFGLPYRRLAAEGRIGEEQPARWTEAARSAVDGIPAARFLLGPTQVLENEGPVEVRATDLSVDIELRHEAELLRVLGALEREAPGMFTLSGCQLVRTDGAGTRGPPPAMVGATCRIRWQSVVLAGVAPGWLPAVGTDRGSDAGSATIGPEEVPVEPPRGTFGRLFTTAAQRARIDAALAAPESGTGSGEAPHASPARPRPEPPPRQVRWMHVDGVIHRSGRSVVVWVDGIRTAHGGPHPERPPGVRLAAGGRSILVRPGQRFNPHTGAVIDPIRSPEGRIRRGQFLQESSAAPLTDLPTAGQN